MEFILQLLAQLFSEPEVEVTNTPKKEEVKELEKEVVEQGAVEAQPEPNLFNVMEFH